MSYTRNTQRPAASPATAGRPPRRRLKTGPLLVLLLLLFVGNLLWFIAWLIPNGAGSSEEVAAVQGDPITRQEWMAAMEEQHGRDTLLGLVNQKVMATAAEEYDIKVSDKEIDLELAMLRTAQDGTDMALYAENGESLREQVKSQLILEKVLTKDIVVEDQKIEAFYKENQALYDVEDGYRTSMMVVESASEAEAALKELENGSSFEALAREKSVDTASASLGGDIGYISPDQPSVDPAVAKAVQSIETGKWSEPVALKDGRLAIVAVVDKAEGQKFSFEEVKGHIGRELALEQLPQSVTPEAFWKEFDAEWFYGQ
ncbi:foldase protein PrsA [Planomicrobium koreense]|uniref:peptidylprolyl isomerase n=1 Tax=Planococcus koreensis TaxID=112331 RepID=A0A7W8CVV4_9BACL|nr:peptidyl-prolyl cis-trans isomerase [Planococcus koreensis]MBB5181889.1 foldase protein PrsA [Planococcus koreensis]